MSRAERIRMRRLENNRFVSFIAGFVIVTFFLAILLSNNNVTAEPAATYKYYTDICVDRNDTLWTIAERYITDEYESINEYIKEVQDLNDLGIDVQYGQHLIVPYYSEERK